MLAQSPARADVPYWLITLWQMSTIEEKLKELDLERQELEQYQAADRERRALEFAVHDRELTSTRKKLEEVGGQMKK